MRVLVPNASMDTRFGRRLSDDQEQRHTRSLSGAEERYEIFHKKEPRRVVELKGAHRIPKEVGYVGECLSVVYTTDKWRDDGDDDDYKHVIETSGVGVYHPIDERVIYDDDGHRHELDLEPESFPVTPPKVVVLLGRCLGYYVEDAETGDVLEANPRGTYWMCSPSGDMLAVYSPSKGFLAFVAGGDLTVEMDGIEG